jgi:hypothetical protein
MRPHYLNTGQPSPFDLDFDTSSLFESPVTTTCVEANGPRVFNIAFRPKTAEVQLKSVPIVVYRQSQRTLPYFGHQQLDLDYFPECEFFLWKKQQKWKQKELTK